MRYKSLITSIIIASSLTCWGQSNSPVPPRRDTHTTQQAPVPPPPGQQSGEAAVASAQPGRYRVVSHPTPNYDRDHVNEVKGVILHHTAEPTAQRSLEVLTSSKRGVGTHVVIDYDGTRYIMCEPQVVTFHAGNSVLNGRESCNYFTIGIEFQGNTLEKPLTQDQIESAIEYLLPIIAQYDIPIENIVTHEMVRQAWKRRYPRRRCYGKVDITQTEYRRFMTALKKALEKK